MNARIIFINGPEIKAKKELIKQLKNKFEENATVLIERKALLNMFNAYGENAEESYEWILLKVLKNVVNNGVTILFDGFLPSRRITQYTTAMKGLPCYWIGVFFKEADSEFYDFSVKLNAEISSEDLNDAIELTKDIEEIQELDNTVFTEGSTIEEACDKIFDFISNNEPKCFEPTNKIEKVARRRMIVENRDEEGNLDDLNLESDFVEDISESNSEQDEKSFDRSERRSNDRSDRSSDRSSERRNDGRSGERRSFGDRGAPRGRSFGGDRSRSFDRSSDRSSGPRFDRSSDRSFDRSSDRAPRFDSPSSDRSSGTSEGAATSERSFERRSDSGERRGFSERRFSDRGPSRFSGGSRFGGRSSDRSNDRAPRRSFDGERSAPRENDANSDRSSAPRSFGGERNFDRAPRSDERRSFGDRGGAPRGRSFGGERRSFGGAPRSGERRSFGGDRGGAPRTGERRSFGGGDRPFSDRGPRKEFNNNSGNDKDNA